MKTSPYKLQKNLSDRDSDNAKFVIKIKHKR